MIIDDSLKKFKAQLDYDARRQNENEKDWGFLRLYHSLLDGISLIEDNTKNIP